MNAIQAKERSDTSTALSRPRVLIVDDEQNILEALQRTLRKENFELLTANSGEKALGLLFNRPVDLIISDQRMPGMGGSELISKVKERYPDTIRIILTGYQDMDAAVAAINEGGAYLFLQKPWDDDVLKMTIRRALHQYQLSQENRILKSRVEKQNAELRELNFKLEQRVEERTALANQKSIEARTLSDDLRKNFASSVEVIRKLIELRQPEEHEVHRHVRKIVDFIIPRLKIDSPESVWISTAASLHGIGRVALPDSILQKSSQQLNASERKLFESHVVFAGEVMNCIPQLQPLSPILRFHQERWDGLGFPDGLFGEQIPIGAQILGISSDYVRFRSWMSKDEAKDRIFRNSGLAYQPKIVQTLLEYIQHEESAMPQFAIVNLKPHQLKEGMVLAKDLKSSEGLLLFARETNLTFAQIKKLHTLNDTSPFHESISVYTRFEDKKERKS